MRKIATIVCLLMALSVRSQVDSLVVHWEKLLTVSKSVPTLQVVVNPPLRQGASIHQPSFDALQELGCDYVRYVPWLPYPRLGVAELEAPTSTKTFWDFSLIDPMTTDFLNATKGHPVILNFSTIPAWMYKTEKPVSYPDSPDSVTWNYTQGTEPRDSSLKEIAAYYARLYSWYTKGGFSDELGNRHVSNYHYSIPFWEILNEVDFEHVNTPESYTRIYDAVSEAIKKESPDTKFVGLALADPNNPKWFEYFLNPKNHKAGIPLDMISYHFYAIGSVGQSLDVMQYTFFDRADGFLNVVRYIEDIRKRLSPATKTTVDEIGSILMSDFSPKEVPIPAQYWNLSAAMYAYVFLRLTNMGIDYIGESQLVGYPSQFPSVSMMNWNTGKPNARYQVLKLIKDNFAWGDSLVETNVIGSDDLSVQGFNTRKGQKMLVINKRNKTVKLALPLTFNRAVITLVDPSTGDDSPTPSAIASSTIELKPFGVAVIAVP
jgi:hypothetical protein